MKKGCVKVSYLYLIVIMVLYIVCTIYVIVIMILQNISIFLIIMGLYGTI